MNLIIPYKDKLYRFALSILKNSYEAEEIIQDLLVKIWSKQSLFKSIENKEAWCMTVTRNLAYDRLRTRKKNRTVEIDTAYGLSDSSLNPEEQLAIKSELKSVMKVVENLSEDLSMVIQLREVEGYSYQEIADITGWNISKVKVNIHRARKELRMQLLNQTL